MAISKILTIGDATLDTFLNIHDATVECDVNKKNCRLCFSYAQKIPIHESIQTPGGNAINVAVGLAKLGLKVSVRSEIGQDNNGNLILETLKKAKIDTSELVRDFKAQTRYSIILNFKGERTILSYHPPHVYRPLKLKTKYNWIYYSSLGPTFEIIQKSLIAWLKNNPQTKLVFNPGSYQLKEKIDEVKKILSYTKILIVNRTEAEQLVGKNKDIKILAAKLLKFGPQIIAITDGPQGAYAISTDEFLYTPALPVKKISTTGAGDAFSSGFIAALDKNKSLKNALAWGIQNSSSVIQHFGAQTGLLSSKDLK